MGSCWGMCVAESCGNHQQTLERRQHFTHAVASLPVPGRTSEC
jgi:hypothetical protein